MRIRWHGHSCFEFTDSKNTVLIDPHDGKSIGIKPPVSVAGIVLISHDHFDHNALRIIKNDHKVLSGVKGRCEINEMVFEGLPSYHDDDLGSRRGDNTIYRFTMDGITICHCGDIGDIPSDEVIESLKGVDIIFVPTGEVTTISIPKLERFLSMVDPKIIVPMHYRVGGLTIPLKTLDDFLKNVSEDMILYVGNEVELFPEEVSEFMGLWVFDR